MKAPQGIIGVVHLGAMPGDPRDARTFAEVETAALRDAEALHAGGVDAIIVENFGSAPFAKGDASSRIPAHQTAFMALVARRLMQVTTLPIGVNCLRNDAYSALGIAAATGASFVRVNVHTGAYLTDQGLIEGEAHHTLRYRAQLGADVALVADVLVKHASPLAPLTPEQATAEAFDRGLADAVVVTGHGTGAPVDRALLERVREAAGQRVVLIGSGLTPADKELARLAQGAIVGTYFKGEGQLGRPVSTARVQALVDALRDQFHQPADASP